MRIKLVVITAAAAALGGCGTNSIYQTLPTAVAGDGQVYLMPYYTKIESQMVIRIQPPPQQTENGNKKPGVKDNIASIQIKLTNIPRDKGFLHFNDSILYNNSVEFSTGQDGLASKADSSASQIVTAILSEIGQASALAASRLNQIQQLPNITGKPPGQPPKISPDELRKECIKELAGAVKARGISTFWSVEKDHYPELSYLPLLGAPLSIKSTTENGVVIDNTISFFMKITSDNTPADDTDAEIRNLQGNFPGFIAYDPSILTVQPVCRSEIEVDQTEADEGKDNTIKISEEQVLPTFTRRHFVNPQRGFWTSPHDTYTMSEGIIIGHKFTNESPAKGVVDLITSPIRAIIPPSTTTTSVSVQTGGGKPDQTTNTTSTQIGTPKD